MMATAPSISLVTWAAVPMLSVAAYAVELTWLAYFHAALFAAGRHYVPCENLDETSTTEIHINYARGRT